MFQKSKIGNFFAGSQYSVVLLEGESKPAEGVSEHKIDGKIEKGFLHFYKKDGKWNYVTESEFEQKKDSLPDLCFACKYPITDLENKPFPDLEALTTKLDQGARQTPTGQFEHLDIINNNIANKKDSKIVGPRYLAYSLINGSDFVVNTHEGGFIRQQLWDMHPLIFYRLRKPLKAGERLPLIDLKQFYAETNYTGYSVKVQKSLQF